jgi:hypothetical protein
MLMSTRYLQASEHTEPSCANTGELSLITKGSTVSSQKGDVGKSCINDIAQKDPKCSIRAVATQLRRILKQVQRDNAASICVNKNSIKLQ